MRHKIADLSQDHTYKDAESYVQSPKQAKKHRVAQKYTIIERLQGEEKDLTAAVYNRSYSFVTRPTDLINVLSLL